MALELPDWLTDAFNLIGLPWPGIDEDQLHDWARSIRKFAADVCDNSSQTNQTMSELADSSQSSVITAVAQQYESHHRLLTELHGPIDDFAQALDYAADAVVAQKWIVIGAATALATEFTATQIGAIFTLGADEAAVPAEVISTQQIVKFALKDLEAVVIGRLINWGAQELSDHVNRSIVTLANDAWGVKMEADGLKIAYEKVSSAAREMRGHADEAERTGNQAHSENTSRNLEDNSGGGGWAEVINALKQGLLDIASDLFKSLPGAIAKVIRGFVDILEKLAARLKGADEEGGPSVTGAGAGARAPETGAAPGSGEPPGSSGADRGPGATGERPGASKSNGECTGAGEPVDVANGDVMMDETDVTLPGVLPLILRRTHRSSRQAGRWFGQSWMSSLDQRLVVTGGRVIGAFDDGRLLTWTASAHADDPPATPETGPRWTLRSDEDGAYTVHDPRRGLTWRFERRAGYDGELPLTSFTDRIGHEIVFNYDAAGRPLSVVHSGGYRVLVSVTDEHVTALTLAGRDGEDDIPLRQFEYGADGNLSGVINSSGLPMRFTYDEAGRLTSWTDRNGYFYRYTYDGQGRCIRGDGPDGAMSGTFEYEPGITRWITIDGAVTTYEVTDSAETAAITDPLGSTARWEHDSQGRVTTHVDPLGHVTRYAYDSQGNLTAVTLPDGAQATAEYDERSLPTLVTDPDGTAWRRDYDEHGNQTLVTAPDGTATRFGYDENGHLASVTGPDGKTVTITCNSAGLPTEVRGQDGGQTRYATDPAGRPSRVTAPDGTVTVLSWTPDSQPASRTFPDGTAEALEWDGEGNLVRQVSPAGAVTSYEYGPFGKVTAVTGPDGTRSEYYYDHELRPTMARCGDLEWRYAYDSAGQLVTETDYNGATTAYSYDAAGRLTRRANAAGQEITFSYDESGNLVAQAAGDSVTNFGYDLAGRLLWAQSPGAALRFDRNALGQIVAETCNGRTVTTTYDPAGRVTERVTPSGRATSWETGRSGKPASMTAGGHLLRFGYDSSGRESSRELPGQFTLTQVWDQRGRLTRQSLSSIPRPGSHASAAESQAGRLLQRRSYAYSPDGYLTGSEDLLAGRRDFALDLSGRVMSVSGPGWAESYSYDPAGNITAAAWPRFSGDPSPWLDTGSQGLREIDGARVARAGNIRYRHDAAGRVISRAKTRLSRRPDTWHYTWDAEDRLTAVTIPDGTAWHYAYDPLGRRIAKQHLSADGILLSETLFSWDGTTLAEQSETIPGADEGDPRIITWDYQPGTFVPVTQTERSDSAQDEVDLRFYAIVTDISGIPTEMIAADGTLAGHQQHTLWGGTVWGSDGASTPLRFPGQYEDSETGLHYNNQRYYDPVTGSYLTRDPLGLAPAVNPYAYVPNPHVLTDPLGLMPAGGSPFDYMEEYGRAAEVATELRLKNEGYEIIGRNVNVRVPSGGLADVDVLGVHGETGRYIAVQSKYMSPTKGMRGEAATRFANQQKLLAELDKNGGTVTGEASTRQGISGLELSARNTEVGTDIWSGADKEVHQAIKDIVDKKVRERQQNTGGCGSG